LYFAHSHAGYDQRQPQKQNCAGHLGKRRFLAKIREGRPNRSEWIDGPGPDENREKNSGNRAACDQP